MSRGQENRLLSSSWLFLMYVLPKVVNALSTLFKVVKRTRRIIMPRATISLPSYSLLQYVMTSTIPSLELVLLTRKKENPTQLAGNRLRRPNPRTLRYGSRLPMLHVWNATGCKLYAIASSTSLLYVTSTLFDALSHIVEYHTLGSECNGQLFGYLLRL